MSWTVTVNGADLYGQHGLAVESGGDVHDAPRRSYPLTVIPGRMGAVLATDPTVEARIMRLTGSVAPSAQTLLAHRASRDALKHRLYSGLTKIVFDDDVTAPREIDGVCTGCTVTPSAHVLTSLGARFELTVVCPDATWKDVVGQLIGFNPTAKAVPLGTAPSGGIIRIAAPAWSANVVDPVLKYYSASGVLIWSMTFSLTLTAGTMYLELDLDRSTAVKVDTSTAPATITEAIQNLSAGDFGVLDPTDGDPLASSYPRLAVTATSGTPSGTWLGHRRWL